MKNKRYTATFDCYIYAESDEDAKQQSKRLAQKLNDEEDRQTVVQELHSTPFGSLTATPIKIK